MLLRSNIHLSFTKKGSTIRWSSLIRANKEYDPGSKINTAWPQEIVPHPPSKQHGYALFGSVISCTLDLLHAGTVRSVLFVRKDFSAGGAVLSEALQVVGSAVAATRRSVHTIRRLHLHYHPFKFNSKSGTEEIKIIRTLMSKNDG